jgi:quercetin dioxygenase-like cupin family protein
MNNTSLEQFTSQMLSRGYHEVLVREWDAHHVTPEHDHPFDTSALVIRGEFWLTVGENTRHLRQGDTFQLDRGIAHSERYGPEGATFWAARRNPG